MTEDGERDARGPEVLAPPPASEGTSSAGLRARAELSAFAEKVFKLVRVIAVLLVLLDVGSLTMLLHMIGVPIVWGVPVALVTGGLSTYAAQFSHLLSRKAFLVHRSPGRHLAMAVVVLIANAGCYWLVAQGEFILYLVTRVLLAVVVVWAWGSRVGPRLLGDGKAAIEKRFAR